MTTTADTKTLTVPGEGRVTAVTYQRVSTKESNHAQEKYREAPVVGQ